MRFAPVFGVLAFLYLASESGADVVRLFNCGTKKPVANYEELVLKLKINDQLIFCDGAQFTLQKKMGEGETTTVFSILEDPKSVLRIASFDYTTEFISETCLGSAFLLKYHVPHVSLQKCYGSQYAIVEKLEGDFATYTEFAKTTPRGKYKDEFSNMVNELRAFSKNNLNVLMIGDLHADNLVYSFARRKWLVMDWTNESIPWRLNKYTPIDLSTTSLLTEIFQNTMTSRHIRSIQHQIEIETYWDRIRYWEALGKPRLDWSENAPNLSCDDLFN